MSMTTTIPAVGFSPSPADAEMRTIAPIWEKEILKSFNCIFLPGDWILTRNETASFRYSIEYVPSKRPSEMGYDYYKELDSYKAFKSTLIRIALIAFTLLISMILLNKTRVKILPL